MAKLTQYTGGLASEGETAVARWIGSEAIYERLAKFSDPDSPDYKNESMTPDDTYNELVDFDILFVNTLYFIHE